MEHSPLVSIIIPTYNNSSVVCQAIDCSFQQTYKNIEVIVVDDGSTDDTENILKEKYNGKIKYIYQQNKGPGGARNTGIRHSSGEYLQFLDADDLLDIDKLRIQISKLLNVSGIALSYCDYVCRDMEDETVTFDHISPLLQEEKPFIDIMMKWETDLCIPLHCFIFDSRLFKDNCIFFDESLLANEDWDCWMKIFILEPEVLFVDRVLAIYRVRRDSRCRDRTKMRKSYLKAIEKQIRINSSSNEIVKKLRLRKKEIKYAYRNVSPLAKAIERCPVVIKRGYSQIVPWRIRQKILQIFDGKLSSL